MSARFELAMSTNGRYHFNLKAGNGEIILSSQMYASKAGAENGIASVKANSADDSRYERRTAKSGEPYFVLKAANGDVIGQSEMYSSARSMESGIESVKRNSVAARTEDLTIQAKGTGS
jgi:hypothetical protein